MKFKHTRDMSQEEKQAFRVDGEWVCPVCGPVVVAPVDEPDIIAIEGSDHSGPKCMTCGSVIQPGLALVAWWADRRAAIRDQIRRMGAAVGIRYSDTWELKPEDERPQKENNNA